MPDQGAVAGGPLEGQQCGRFAGRERARANIGMNVATSTQEPIMTPRTPDNIWSLVTIMGRNAIPPRDPDDDDDEDEDDEEDEDGEDDPAVVREPDE